VRYAIDIETRYRELREALLLNTIDEEPTVNRSTPGTSATCRGGSVAVTESVRDPWSLRGVRQCPQALPDRQALTSGSEQHIVICERLNGGSLWMTQAQDQGPRRSREIAGSGACHLNTTQDSPHQGVKTHVDSNRDIATVATRLCHRGSSGDHSRVNTSTSLVGRYLSSGRNP
jgi:hypothetical protein